MTSAARQVDAQMTTARLWNEHLLHAISIDTARPTVHARNLFYLSAAMYDAWAAYDSTADQYVFHEKHLDEADVVAARNKAISYAAYNMILYRFVTGPAGVGPGRSDTELNLRTQMTELGYDPDFTSTIGNSPAALGNRIAQALIDHGLQDGANESGNYASQPGTFAPVNPPLTFENPGTVMNDFNRWQPLHFLGNRIDQFGRPINEATQKNLTPFWGEVTPFAMADADRGASGVYHDQGPPPQLGGPGDATFKQDAVAMIRYSSQLDPNDGVMIDISPASRGNSQLGSYEQVGYTTNPETNLPYAPQLVKQADFARVMAEFWADGPHSTAPPGHWNEIRNDVSDQMTVLGIPKRIGGAGPVVDDLEWDVKGMFALNGGLHDAAIVAWNHKGVYDSVRPISFIRFMGQSGQSSDPDGPSYDPNGLPLEPGLIEVITAETTAPGQRHARLAGNEGKIAVRSWRGAVDGVAPFDDPSEIGGVDWILAENWMPYQLSSFVTPPFPGRVSGHSTFSRTAAEVMTLLTGTPYFPGGLGGYHIEMGGGLNFEYGPTTPLDLQWATYFDAADQAALSRIWGGIHPPSDDVPGRLAGHEIGPAAWNLASRFFEGTATPEPASGALVLIGVASTMATGLRRRVKSC
ncbi:MAG: vanadium-dependent haloperoxidase [Pirellulales bacterium]|nr:vanadium-dependent haloperoxidase [Pirellulales bacterium]